MKKHDLIVLGDATLDIFFSVDRASVQCDVNKEHCKICFDYGDKILAEDVLEALGGNAVNVAIAARKLGAQASLWSILGDDGTGKKIMEKLKKEKVDLSYTRQHKGVSSNLSSIITYQNERTIFTHHAKKEYKLPKFKPSKWLYLTSMYTGSEKIYSNLITYIQKNETKMVYGPGSYQRKQGLSKMKRLLKHSYGYISNKEEVEEIFDIHPKYNNRDKDFVTMLEKVQSYGPEMVIITDGIKGLYACDRDHKYYLGSFPSKVVERTGAGDSFSGGVMAALVAGRPVSEAVVWGVLNASQVVTKLGAQNGQLSLKEMKSLIKKNPKFKASELDA